MKRENSLLAAVIVLSFWLHAGCREKTAPTSTTTPPPTQVWDSLGLAGATVHAIASDRRRIFVGTANGFYRSLDSGRTWLFTASINGRSLFTSVAISGTNVLVGSDTNLSVSSNDGTTWTSVIAPVSVFAMAHGSEYLFAATSMGIIRSQDRGFTWTSANTGLPSPLPEVRGLSAEGITLCLGSPNAVFVSLHSGDSWTQAPTPWSPHTVDRVLVNKEILYVATTGGLYTSRTRGSSWILAAVGIPETSRVVGFAAIKSGVYAATDNAGVLTSANGGLTWIFNNFNLPDLQLTTVAADSSFVYAATRRRGIWRYLR